MRRGQLSFAILFVFLAIILAIVFAVAIPTILRLVTGLYSHAESVLADTEESIHEIQDAEVKSTIEDVIGTAKDSTVEQVEILSTFYQYGWAITIIVIVLVITILARRAVEYTTTRGGIV